MSDHPLGHMEVTICKQAFRLEPCFEAMAESEMRAGAGLFEIGNMAFSKKVITGRHVVGVIYGCHYGANPEKAMPFEEFSKLCMKHGVNKLYATALKLALHMLNGLSDVPIDGESPEPEKKTQ